MWTYADLISEDLRRWPVEQCTVVVHTVDQDRPAPTDVVDAVLRHLLHTGGLDDDVEAVRVVLLELLPLRAGVLAVELDVLVAGEELLRDVHLYSFVGGNDDAVSTVQLQQLSENQTGRPCAKE